jgi:penicillin-binding protein 1A
VLARDGSTIGSFGEQKRTLLAQKDIPKVFTQALISVEDSSFYKHNGIDMKGIARAAWHDLTTLSSSKGPADHAAAVAQTLPETRQDAAAQGQGDADSPSTSKSATRRTRSFACTAIRSTWDTAGTVWRRRPVLLRQARRRSGLPESALLAGLIQRPEGLSPYKNPEGSVKRRNHVLDRMVNEGALSRSVADTAKTAPLQLATRRDSADIAPYFVEEVRRALQAKYGDEGIYQGGLEVTTGIDVGMQKVAGAAVEYGLRQLDKRQGWRGRIDKVAAGTDPAAWASASWRDGVVERGIYDGVVLSSAHGKVRVKAGKVEGSLDAEGVAWTGKKDPAALVRTGDIVRVRVVSAKIPGQAVFALEQEPRVEAALVAIDPKTGAVRALVGGFDFRRSEFDRAMQARRQAGSSFKPFVFAAALQGGATLSDRVLDAPTVFVEPGTLSTYQPENYGDTYYGLLTVREALEKSANISAVKMLDRAGFAPVIELARRLGLTTALQPYPSMALGAFEVSLLEMTSAYGTFANQGVHVAPYLVEEVKSREGSSLERTRPEVSEALDPQIATIMNALLEGVITDGTGAAAASLGRPLAGKTGTTDDFTDAWFIGYTPDLVVGVWVGFDTKKSLGSRETGAHAALPIWQKFMDEALRDVPPVPFPDIGNITRLSVDRATGLRAETSAGCTDIIDETFATGTEPMAPCSTSEHARLALPWILQRYPLDEAGFLVVPEDDLAALAGTEPYLVIDPGHRSIGTAGPAGQVTIPMRVVPGRTLRLPASLEGRVDPTPWVGKDGRPADVILLGESARAGTEP